ncbi:TrmH family RNA methyltransferase [Thermodesulfobacterium hveragerdense]|uniref:TrmH family RNA methyltransferase n=1 Tax=Thermodesulfobacterium hveragerdense TaxID=53424 RepID=UPI000401F50E|nr:RNA methyltransferase [Thermodesulfobacterium hveragerdense]
MKTISSRSNPTFKFLKALKEIKGRKEHQAFLVEGVSFVRELLAQEKNKVLWVVFERGGLKKLKPLLKQAEEAKISILVLEDPLFKELVVSDTPQGVLAVVKFPIFEDLSERLGKTPCCVVVLEEIQDPSNVGAIIRTAAAVGVACVFYTKGTADPFSPKAVRASAGAVLHVPVIKFERLTELAEDLKKRGFGLTATVVKGGEELFSFSFPPKTALVFGNEAKGLSKEGMEVSDYRLTIPIVGKVESLNVAVSAGILLYQWLKDRFNIVKTQIKGL